MGKIHSVLLVLEKSITEKEFDEIKQSIPLIIKNILSVRKYSEEIVYLSSYDRAKDDILRKIREVFCERD